MRNPVWKILLIAVLSVLVSCGTATDVGNPSGPLPTTQLLTGQIDGSTIVLDASTTKEFGPDEGPADGQTMGAVDDMSQFKIFAVSEDGSLSFSDQLDAWGFFAIEVDGGYVYTFDLRQGETVVGQFDFKQDTAGGRGPRLDVRSIDQEIDMGTVRFENGEFVPQVEPFDEIEAGGGYRQEGGDGEPMAEPYEENGGM